MLETYEFMNGFDAGASAIVAVEGPQSRLGEKGD